MAGGRLRWRQIISGRVQGVGFRPALYRLAQQLGLAGWVGNVPAGVCVEIEGDAQQVEQWRRQLLAALPPLARIEHMQEEAMPACGETQFHIRASEAGGKLTLVPPDLALCDACRQELHDPASRRYRYPFINCTRCGPRYSIAEALPYDRDHTVMRHFPPCPACAAEYADPNDRRFHHQGITCAQCGPSMAFRDAEGRPQAAGEAALQAAVAQLRAGAIIALKGLGGFQLLLDARNETAVQRLRQFKQRPRKPFAIMVADLQQARTYCTLGAEEAALLQGPASPLLLADCSGEGLAPGVAPGQRRLGIMLPYTPLHDLLLREFAGPLIATSGNRGGEPICIDEHCAPEVFRGLVDGLLVHDRPIVRGVDDSIVQWADGAARLLRRARGYVPEALPLAQPAPALLAAGAHLKNTLALCADRQLVVSTHIGDLQDSAARHWHAHMADDLQQLLQLQPQLIVHDSHADYASSEWAQQQGRPLCAVQHHVAHLAGCALEYGLPLPVMGSVWDGSGLGDDGTLWGGESLLLQAGSWQRLGHLRHFVLPGGEAAAREPRRSLLGLLLGLLGDAAWEHALMLQRFSATELRLLRTAVGRGINCPLTSSAGRLFDGISSLLGLCQVSSYEGEAAMLLQAAAEADVTAGAGVAGAGVAGAGVAGAGTAGAGTAGAGTADAGSASGTAGAGLVEAGDAGDWRPLLQHMLIGLENGRPLNRLALEFHQHLAHMIVQQARHMQARQWLLTGGCFQNRLLLQEASAALRAAQIEPLSPSAYPPGDGGLALGQLAWVLYQGA